MKKKKNVKKTKKLLFHKCVMEFTYRRKQLFKRSNDPLCVDMF